MQRHNVSSERNITIFFNDGADFALTSLRQKGNPPLMAKRVETVLESRQLA